MKNPGRVALWGVTMLPLLVQLWRYAGEELFYGEFLQWTGVQSARLLLLTLAITPLLAWRPRQPVLRWLQQRRRDLGLITFAYALAHCVAYLHYKRDLHYILADAAGWAMAAGWLAAVLMTLLAVTSNNLSLRLLGRRWRQLHRSVYVMAVLTCLHWVGTAFDPLAGLLHAGVLALLLGLRVWRPKPAG